MHILYHTSTSPANTTSPSLHLTLPLHTPPHHITTQQERGTGMILKLCRDVMNLEQLIQNGTVMGALTRVLQEEFKKSVELSFNILR